MDASKWVINSFPSPWPAPRWSWREVSFLLNLWSFHKTWQQLPPGMKAIRRTPSQRGSQWTHQILGGAESCQAIQGQQISRVLVHKLCGLFEAPLLLQNSFVPQLHLTLMSFQVRSSLALLFLLVSLPQWQGAALPCAHGEDSDGAGPSWYAGVFPELVSWCLPSGSWLSLFSPFPFPLPTALLLFLSSCSLSYNSPISEESRCLFLPLSSPLLRLPLLPPLPLLTSPALTAALPPPVRGSLS